MNPFAIPIFLLQFWAFMALWNRYNIINFLNTTKRKNKSTARSAIFDAAKKSNSPILDYVMGVERMSERDRAWYELYKQYGNRNHTWQDFRDMFNDDIITACKTVANWHTWKQANTWRDMAEQQKAKVNRLLGKLNMQSIAEVSYHNLQSKYPDLIAEYEKFLILYYSATPNYCTYNPEIAKLKQKFNQSGQNIFANARYVKKMNKFITFKNADFVVAERLDNYYKIISKHPTFLQQLRDTKKTSKDIMFQIANKILDDSATVHGTPKSDITLVKNTYKDGTYWHETNDIELVNSFLHSHNFWRYLDTIIHEDTHRIDYKNPDYGMLGSQIMDTCAGRYSNLPDLYPINPTEQIAFYTANIVSQAIRARLQHKK